MRGKLRSPSIPASPGSVKTAMGQYPHSVLPSTAILDRVSNTDTRAPSRHRPRSTFPSCPLKNAPPMALSGRFQCEPPHPWPPHEWPEEHEWAEHEWCEPLS